MAFSFNPFTGNFDQVQGSAGIGDSIGSGTEGSVLFLGTSGVLAQDNSNLFWDDANNRLGIGHTSPAGQVSAKAASFVSSGQYFSGFSSAGSLEAALRQGSISGYGGNLYLGNATHYMQLEMNLFYPQLKTNANNFNFLTDTSYARFQFGGS